MRIVSQLCLALLLLCPILSLAGERTTVGDKATAGDKGSAGGKATAGDKGAPGKHALSGMWGGTYYYPDGSAQEPVKFQIALIQDGNMVVGFIKEPNTFGKPEEPWLHAGVKGRFDPQTGKLTFTKTYDGTAGVQHDVEYQATVSEKGMRIEGTWNIGELQGRFTLQKQRIDDKTLEGLK